VTRQHQVERRPICAKETYEKRPMYEMIQFFELVVTRRNKSKGDLFVRKRPTNRDLQKRPMGKDV